MSSRPQPRPDAGAAKAATVLGLRVDALPAEEALARCAVLLKGEVAAHLVTGNALMAVEAQKDPSLVRAWNDANLVLADSSGLVWAARRLRQPALRRLPGIDLAFDLCRTCAIDGTPVFLLGGAPGVADRAADDLRRRLPGIRIVGARNGFFRENDEHNLVRDLHASGARLFLYALGMPRQEKWIHAHKAALPAGLHIGVGGSFDVWAGDVRRAPRWLQRVGFEWLFRLFLEPWRGKRMLGLPVFVWRVLLSKQTQS